MKSKLPEKIQAPTMTVTGSDLATICPLNQEAQAINTLIDHLKDYEAEQDRRLTELDNRIQAITNNQLEVRRGEAHFVPVPFIGTEATTAPTTVPNTVTVIPADRIDYCGDCGKEHGYHCPKEQPKRWRAEYEGPFYYVSTSGEVHLDQDYQTLADNYLYAIGNYHQTREAAEAYKARLLELGKEI